MAKRTLTLLVEFDDDDLPSWIWVSHKYGIMRKKVYVKTICEGDQVKDMSNDEENV